MKFLAHFFKAIHLWINSGLLTCCTEFYCFFWAYLYIVLWNHLIRVHSPFMGLTHQICCFWFFYGIILYIHLQKITLTKDKLGSQKTNYDSNDYFLCWKTGNSMKRIFIGKTFILFSSFLYIYCLPIFCWMI